MIDRLPVEPHAIEVLRNRSNILEQELVHLKNHPHSINVKIWHQLNNEISRINMSIDYFMRKVRND